MSHKQEKREGHEWCSRSLGDGGCEAKLEAGAVTRGQMRRLEFIQTVNGSHGKILSRGHLLPGGGGGRCHTKYHKLYGFKQWEFVSSEF